MSDHSKPRICKLQLDKTGSEMLIHDETRKLVVRMRTPAFVNTISRVFGIKPMNSRYALCHLDGRKRLIVGELQQTQEW